MTTGRAFEFQVGLDISDVLSDFRRIEREAAQTARKVANVGRGVGGAAGRGLGGAGRTVAAGAGVGAGLAVFEQVIEKIFELFEGTPVLTKFTEALDLVFKGLGPVVGVLLDALTPVIVALTPAIAPLAMALIPLVEIFGTNLLIAVTLLTPLITLAAKGVEFLTTGLQTFINAGINFVIDQLNRLPFVDIQLEIGSTGDKFEAMQAQIEAVGDAAGTGPGTAEGNMRALAGSTMEAGEAADEVALAAREAARTQASYADSQRIVDEVTANADARLEAYAKRLELATMEVATADRSLALMAEVTDRAAGSVDQLAHDMDLLDGDVSDLFQNIMTVAVPAVSELDQRIADMTMQIMDAQTEAGLAEMAFAGLTPEMQAAAAELGLFGSAIQATAAAAAAAAAVAAAAVAAANAAGAGGQGGRRGGGGQAAADADRSGDVQRGIALAETLSAFDANTPFPQRGDFDSNSDFNAASRAFHQRRNAVLTRFNPYTRPQGFSGISYPSTYNPPAAQFGAYVRGTREGRHVIVGENFTDEVIRPLREAPDRGGPIVVNVMVGDETVEAVTSTSENRRGSE